MWRSAAKMRRMISIVRMAPTIPRITRIISPPSGIERIVPTIIPTIHRHYGSSPTAKHRSHIFRLNPNLITRHHNIIECRIIRRGVEICIRISQVIVARRHTICWRLKSIKTTCVCTLIIIGKHAREIICCSSALRKHRLIILRLCRSGLCLCEFRLPECLTSLGSCLRSLGLSLLTLGNLRATMHLIQIITYCGCLERCRAATQHCQPYRR